MPKGILSYKSSGVGKPRRYLRRAKLPAYEYALRLRAYAVGSGYAVKAVRKVEANIAAARFQYALGPHYAAVPSPQRVLQQHYKLRHAHGRGAAEGAFLGKLRCLAR